MRAPNPAYGPIAGLCGGEQCLRATVRIGILFAGGHTVAELEAVATSAPAIWRRDQAERL